MTIEIVQDEVAPAMYQRSVNAALQVGRSKFDLAEALALDIPAVSRGTGDGSVTDTLKEIAQEIANAGGDEITWHTLDKYRLAAMWVGNGDTAVQGFGWRKGSSISAHITAAKGGMSYDLFAKQQRTEAEVRAMLGNKISGETKQTVEEMTDTDKAELIAALVKDNTDAVSDAVQAKLIDDLPPHVSTCGVDGPPPPIEVSGSDDNIQAIAAIKDGVSGAVTWHAGMLVKWTRALYKVKGVMNEGDREVIAGYYLELEKLYTEAAKKLKDNTWK